MEKSKILITTLSLITFLTFYQTSLASSGVAVNEIAWMGTANSANDEWIELYNPTNQDIDLSGWTLSAEDGSPSINLSGSITALGFFLLERTSDDTITNIQADLIYTGALSNDGEILTLKNSSGIEIDKITSSGNWQAGDNATKQTMQKTSDGNWTTAIPTPKSATIATEQTQNNPEQNNSQNIQQTNPETASSIIQTPAIIANAGENIIAIINQEITFDGSKSQGTNLSFEWNFGDGQTAKTKITKHKYSFPGKYIVTLSISSEFISAQHQIIATIHPTGIYINEFLPSPSDTEEDEWVEIHNANNFSVDLSGWALEDSSESKGFIIPQNTFIASKSYLVFTKDTTKISLNNDSDTLSLYYPEGILIEEIKYDKAKKGYSVSRGQTGDFVWTANPSPSSINIFSSSIQSSQKSLTKTVADTTSSDPKNIIHKKTFSIAIGDTIFKNLISTANAMTVSEEETQTNKTTPLTKPERTESDKNSTNTDNLSANIGDYYRVNSIIAKIFLMLATIGIFVLMWRAMGKEN